MSDIFNKGMEQFIETAQEELRQSGLGKTEIETLSESMRNTYNEELELHRRLKGAEPSDLEEFIDDILRLTISRLQDEKLRESVELLWSLRAEQRLERLERNTEGESGKIIEFKKPH